MAFALTKGRRYRVTILPAGARTRTIEFEGNYLGRNRLDEHEFDCRPEMGTQTIHDESIRRVVDIGAAVWSRA